jgi:hypothetical protein
MAEKEYRIINIICHRLPYDLSNQVYNEFESRYKEVMWLVEHSNYYKRLRYNLKSVEILLALSIFYKRVISNLDAVVKFYGTVQSISQADTIAIGRYDLDSKEKNKLLGIVLHYRAIKQRFGLDDRIFEYYETKDFLKQIIKYRSSFAKKRNQDGDYF